MRQSIHSASVGAEFCISVNRWSFGTLVGLASEYPPIRECIGGIGPLYIVVYRAVGEAISLRHWGGCTAAVTTNWAWLQDWRQEVEGGVNGTGIVPHVDWARQNHDFATLTNLA